MPGILGFCGVEDQEAAERLLSAMIRAMGDDESCKVDACTTTNLGLARIHLDIIDRAPQPLWSDDGNIALVMTGEIFSWDGLALDKPLTGKEPDFSNADLLLAAYMQFGEAFVDHINGTFAAAIWNVAEQTLLLVNDPVCSYPLYYAQVGDTVVFGSGARAVAQAPGLRRAANPAAIADLVTFEHLYGDKTLFAGVHHLSPGTIMRFHAGILSQIRYADYQYPEYYEIHEEQYYIDAWIHYMRQAVALQTRGPAPLGVMLTGGLDSRVIVGMLANNGIDVRTMTFGIPDCDDERAARELAHVLRLPHKFYPLPPDYLAHLAAKAVRITDGQKNITHANMIGALSDIVQEAKVLYKGFLGGTIHGYVVSRNRLMPLREDVWFDYLFQARNRVFPERDLAQLYTDEMYRLVRDLPRPTLRKALARSQASWWVDKDNYNDLYEEDARFTIMGVELARSLALVRTPLVDKDLLQFVVSVPPGFRQDKSYYRRAIIKALPELAKVIHSGTRHPLTGGNFRDLGIRFKEQTRWWLRNKGLRWVPVERARPYADYATWLRTDLRPWVEEVLLSPQSLERGNFQPSYLRNLVAEHMAGCDHTHRLGVLLTLELWYREFAD